MATTDQTETPLMYGQNVRELLSKRKRLMQAHRGDEPYVDPDYIYEKAAERR
jgi:hypothetical protein